ncbi:hypothetical protein JCM15548_14116 [Geofilum rubicundum JCM 15548]|uniref:DarT domain-containing protein n=2 Tax=Geofilum TaxID=1236988 RepID=A0A0E9M297_9BACT|nr:hypothetical protein JCM15548_14116 [Geofilum rubicundum JCM 15548]
MLYVIQNGFNMVAPTPAENIVYCVSSVQKMIDLGLDFVFTDGHAIDGFSSQHTAADLWNIETLLDMRAIYDRYWNDENDLDKKRRKEAEFLVVGDIASSAILGYLTYNENARDRVVNFGADADAVHVRSRFYF